jgi:enterochelin esterase-like enzyme
MRQYGGRNVWVHLPTGYDPDRPEPYPLLVLHDGQNVSASRPEAWGGSWRADETIDRLAEAGTIPPVVLAAVDHAGTHRIKEFTPPPRAFFRRRPAERYDRLLRETILPGLAADLHVRTDPQGLAMGGSSMGALVTTWMAARHAGEVGRLLLMSPSVWWKWHRILSVLRRRPIHPDTRVWMDIGRHEGARFVRDAEALRDAIVAGGCRRVRYVEDPDGDHSEASWARRLPDALRWLYQEPEEDGAS